MMMMMVLALVNHNFSHMMGDAKMQTEAFVIPAMMGDAVPVVCQTLEDGAPFSMIEYR